VGATGFGGLWELELAWRTKRNLNLKSNSLSFIVSEQSVFILTIFLSLWVAWEVRVGVANIDETNKFQLKFCIRIGIDENINYLP